MTGIYELTVAPTVEPVWIDEVKAHSRIGITQDDILIQDKIIAVRSWIEDNYDLVFCTQTWTLKLESFPVGDILIYKRPVQSITKIEYKLNGVLTTLSTAVYAVDLKARPPRITLAYNQLWPLIANEDSGPGAVVVTFKAGWGDTAASVPQQVRQFLLFRIADFYENRETYTTEKREPIPFIESLIRSERLAKS